MTSTFASMYKPTGMAQAMAVAQIAHMNQVDKSGAPYILHVRSVAQAVHEKYGDVELTIAAMLHDVIKDSEITAERLASTFNTRVVEIVSAVSRPAPRPPEGPSYPDYIQSVIEAGRDAMWVKLEDLYDHMRKDTPENLEQRYKEAICRIELALGHLK